MRRKYIILSLLISVALLGCGVTGSLKTPPPLFGDKTKVPVEQAEADTRDDDIDEDRDLSELLDELED